MVKTLTQEDIDGLVKKLQLYKYVVSVAETELGPLKSAPQIEGDVETKDLTLYETGSEAQASFLVKNNVKLTIDTENVDEAMKLMGEFTKGENVLDSTKKKKVTLVPITSDSDAETITFENAFLQPGLSMTLGEDDEANSVTLVFLCRPGDDGKPFKYAVGGDV